ncbi:tripartite tricarboxylate transporter substrate binding protein [Acetobacteraceae bacterium H6797]|nr:tripartite tricarboxylate transporter substrate binding protein [Acetobacteraceae bacterium H6797]
MYTRRATLAALLAAPAIVPFRASAQSGFPEQPVRMIIPFPPGGPADQVGRIISKVMGEKLGKPVVIDSRSGAGGVIGVDAVAKSKPDGQTIGLASTGALAILPHLQPNMPYDPLKDLAPIGMVISVPQVAVVSPKFGVNDLKSLVARAKAKPGEISYGSAGIGSSLHLAAELFRLRAGIDIVHVPYRGAAPAVTDLLGGQIQLILADLPVVLPHIRAGSLKALGVTAKTRAELLPEVPTFEEQGFPGVISDTWYGVIAPTGVPADRIATLSNALSASLADEETKRLLREQAGTIADLGPDGFASHIREQSRVWGEVVRAANIKLE